MWFITQCSGVGFCGSHRAGDSVHKVCRQYDTPFPCFPGFFCVDGDEVSTATMCPTTQCTTCWCPRDSLVSTKDTFPFRDTVEVCSELEAERERLLDPDGTPRD